MAASANVVANVLDFSNLSNDEIANLLKSKNIVLTPDEARIIQNKILKRPPTFAECVLWSIQGSEHCSYKSSRKYLKTLTTDGPNVILGAKEDAGIVSVAKDNNGLRYGIVISHESHNHPSQIVPYEGAATGVGGNVRDVCCMGAEVIALGNSLRFGDINRQKTSWIQDGVVAGIGGYGNPIGVPTLAGDVYYDAGYNDNCLVTVVTLGIVREDEVIHSYAPANADNYVFILVGKATDNSGFGGASFASTELSDEQNEKNKGAVQEPNAFLKRHLLKANYALFKKLKEKNLIDKVGFKDLGAGGIACASVEMAEASGYGAEIELDLVPVSMKQLPPYVVLCSETQERFMWLVPPEHVAMILEHYNITFALPEISAHAQATVVGKIRSDGLYIVTHQQEEIVNARACDITQGILYDRPIKSYERSLKEPVFSAEQIAQLDHNAILLKLLAHENISSRAPIFETYDKQVQGRTILEAGESDAGLMQPFNDDTYPEEIRKIGIALAMDQNPRINKMDPYWGAVNAVVEAAANVVATGANPQAITDCLCFGNPEKPEQMYDFVESVRGIADACKAIGLKDYPDAPLPVISGNVSLYNESKTGAIPPSPMISCLGNLPDIARAVSFALQSSNHYLVLVGDRKDECGGSVFYSLYNELGANFPKPNLSTIRQTLLSVADAIQQGLVRACHDISDGGVAVALAEMTFKNNIGVNVVIPGDLSDYKKLYAQTPGFILEVAKKDLDRLRQIISNAIVVGETIQAPFIQIQNCIQLPIESAKKAWENGLRDKLL